MWNITGEPNGVQQPMLRSQFAIEEDQEFVIVQISRQQSGREGSVLIDNASLIALGEECDINGTKYKPIASITSKRGGQSASGHFTFQCRRGDTCDWFEIDDSLKPKIITQPRNGFLYLFWQDAPTEYF